MAIARRLGQVVRAATPPLYPISIDGASASQGNIGRVPSKDEGLVHEAAALRELSAVRALSKLRPYSNRVNERPEVTVTVPKDFGTTSDKTSADVASVMARVEGEGIKCAFVAPCTLERTHSTNSLE